MKKIALLAILALLLGVGAPVASAAGWRVDITNDADGALFLINLKKKADTDIQVFNNANVSLNETNVVTTGSSIIAGGDAKANFQQGGDIDSVTTDETSVNDVLIATNDCGCDGEDLASSDVVEIVNGEEGNDAIFTIDAETEEENEIQTANNLEYNENLVDVFTSGTSLNSGDDAKENVMKGGKADITKNRTRNLGTVSVFHNIPLSFSL